VHVDDLYGPGRSLTTNSQRFRSKVDFTRKVPEGKIRILCSGDSFTLGYGVDDDRTWCSQLTELDGRLETVNMGQGGYGVDQAYLCYRRNRDLLESQIHIFAFISADFRRMKTGTFVGYGKPLLGIEGDSLVVENAPVPRPAFLIRGLNQLQSIRFLRSLFGREADTEGGYGDEMTGQITTRIFDELRRMSAEKGIDLLLLYLPTKRDGTGIGTGNWLDFTREYAEKNNVRMIDLVGEFQSLPGPELNRMFRGAHYSEKGNRFVAEKLLEKLVALGVVPKGSENHSRR